MNLTRRGRIRRTQGFLTKVALAGMGLVIGMTVVPPAAARVLPAEACKPRVVIGARGSNEQRTGAFEMGPRLAPYALKVAELIPQENVEFISLEYPASDLGLDWFNSVGIGIQMLTDKIREIRGRCQGTTFGLMGYSQGAFVVNRVLSRRLTAPELVDIRSVLLIADPVSAGRSDYGLALTTEGEPAPPALGGMLGRFTLPFDIRSRTIDFCLKSDAVCDTADSLELPTPENPDPGEIANIIEVLVKFATGPHLTYHTCCPNIYLPDLLAEQFAMRLRSDCDVTSGSNQVGVPIPDSPTNPPGPPARSGRVEIEFCPANASPISKVEVDITHTFCGDLSIDLVRSPADTGDTPRPQEDTVFRLKAPDETDGRECDGVQSYSFNGFGTTAEGLWTLVIQDHSRLDTGTLNGWRLELW